MQITSCISNTNRISVSNKNNKQIQKLKGHLL